MAKCVQSLNTGEMTWSRSLLVSPSVKSLGAYVIGAGFKTVPPAHSDLPYQHSPDYAHVIHGQKLPAYRFAYITCGTGIFTSKPHRNEPVQAGDMIILFPQMWHHYHPSPDTGWNEYWIDFDGDYIRRLMTHQEFSQNEPVRCIGMHEDILDLFLKVIELLKNEPSEYQLLLGTLAAQTAVQVLSALKSQCYKGHSDAAIIREAKRWLGQDSMHPKNLDQLASRLNVNYSSFRRLFKARTGVSPRQFALEAKLQKARNLLARTETAVNSVAEQCGLERDYFFRFFKKKIGLTPMAFRRLHQNCQ